MPSSSGYYYRFSTHVQVLGVHEESGTTYVRIPGSATFKNLDPEIDLKAVPNPTSGALAKFWTAPLFMTEKNYEHYKPQIKEKTIRTFPDPKQKPELYWVYTFFKQSPSETIHALNSQLWTYPGPGFAELPDESKLHSVFIDMGKFATVSGIDVRAEAKDGLLEEGVDQPNYGDVAARAAIKAAITSPEERRAFNENKLITAMTFTLGTTSTAPLPSTVLVSLGTRTAGVRDFLTVNIPPQTRANNYLVIRAAIAKALKDKGFSISYINQFFRDNPKAEIKTLPTGFGSNAATTNANTTRGGGGGRGGNKSSKNVVDFGITPKPSVESKVIVRFGSSYTTPKALENTDTRPQMIQYVTNSPVRTATDFQNGKSIREEDRIIFDEATGRLIRWSTQQATLKYVFPYIPTDIQYSSLGAQWTEVPRAKNIPFVDFQGFQRMKVSFSFLIAATRQDGETTVPDGLFVSVDEQITLLRKMYQSKQPVTIYNMDGLLSNSAARLNNNPVQFVIADLAIEAIRRQGTNPSHITTAQCSITLNEIIVENAVLINIRPPTFDELVPTSGKSGPVTPQRPDLWTDYLPQPNTQIFTNDSQLTIGTG